jgi:hypothetical protein
VVYKLEAVDVFKYFFGIEKQTRNIAVTIPIKNEFAGQ